MSLTEQEKRELLEMARSETLRDDFRRLRAEAKPLSPEQFLDFLTSASKVFPPRPDPPPKRYARALI